MNYELLIMNYKVMHTMIVNVHIYMLMCKNNIFYLFV